MDDLGYLYFRKLPFGTAQPSSKAYFGALLNSANPFAAPIQLIEDVVCRAPLQVLNAIQKMEKKNKKIKMYFLGSLCADHVPGASKKQ